MAVLPPANCPPLPQGLLRRAAQGERIGIALGRFALVHAGSVRFLRLARARCDRLFVLVLCEPNAEGKHLKQGNAPSLLALEEKVRILRALREVEGAEIAPAAMDWAALHRAVPRARWFAGAEEGDVPLSLVDELRRVGVGIQVLLGSGPCTTQVLLRRMRKG